MSVRGRGRGRSRGEKKTENRARRLGFGCALSNGNVGQWRGVLGWCGQGGGGGGVCAFECAPGGEAGAIKKRKPSSPARVRGGPVKRRGRAKGGGRGGGGRGRRRGPKNPKTELAGSFLGAPCQTAV